MELFTRQAAVALFFGLFATSTQAKEFSYLETFDDDATFSAGATLPTDGSATPQPFQRHLPSFPTVLTVLLTLSTPSTKV